MVNFDINSEVSHYKLLEKLGSGGMSIVYKAKDLKLDRFVALKFLPFQIGLREDDKVRFVQEAKATSALDHPNICTIFEIDETDEGQIFISMAYYQGETLRERINKGPMSIKEAIEVTKQICDGLSKAHGQGIIHRDVKPANIIITDDGVVKIVDFGVAKFMSQKGSTAPGSVIGTPGYMSPEQARGKDVDHRTDVWSIGIIFFEMLTSQLPFEGNSDLSLMYAIVNDTPLQLSQFRKNVPVIIQNIIDKTLEKDPVDRYQHLNGLVNDLQSWEKNQSGVEITKAIVLPKIYPSIAVLPFTDLSPQKDQEYFCDGLTEEIINALTHVANFRVISRNSAFQFKGKNLDISEIGRKLKVRSVLEGSIRKEGNKLRIAIRLINVSDGFLLWSNVFEKELSDVFVIQDEIARAVVNTLADRLAEKTGVTLVKTQTVREEAYNVYLKGRYEWNKRTAESLEKSIDYFNRAIQIDPDYALAYAGLADANIVLSFYGKRPPKEVMPRAIESAEHALELDGSLAESEISLGCAKAVYEWDWDNAEVHFKRGMEMNKDYAIAHHWYAINYLTPLMRFEDAERETIKALELDPISPVFGATVGLTYYFARQYDDAINFLRKALEMNPNFAITNFFMGRALVQKSLFKEGINYFQKALKIYGESPNMLATFGNALALAGKKRDAHKVLKQLSDLSKKVYVSSYDIASVYCGLGNIENAWSWLERALDERAYLLIYLKVDPIMDFIRLHKKYKELVQKIF